MYMKFKQFFFGVLLAIFAGLYIIIANSVKFAVDLGALFSVFVSETCLELYGMLLEIFGDDE